MTDCVELKVPPLGVKVGVAAAVAEAVPVPLSAMACVPLVPKVAVSVAVEVFSVNPS